MLKIMAVRLAHSLFRSSGGGSATPAVILHGLFGSGNNWRTIASKLASDTNRLVYTLDARNHGDTQHTSEMTYDLMSQDTLKFIQDQGLDKVVLIGHSMGGKTAMATALGYPDVIEGLVVVDVSPHKAPGEGESTDLIRAMKNLDLTSLSSRREADAILKNDIKEFSLRQFLLTNLVQNGRSFSRQDQSLRWKVNLDAIESNIQTLKSFPDFETTYERPALFIGGGDSNYITAADIPRIKELFPVATVRHIPGAGHWAHFEKPKEFLQLMREFLSNCDSTTDSIRTCH